MPGTWSWRRREAGSETPRGLTLTEVLLASALSLVVMGAVGSLFTVFGRSVKRSQATINQSALLRSAAWQLRQDLAGATSPLRPWLAPEANAGYFELLEGPARDTSYAVDGLGQPTSNLTADTDDVLLFTTESLAGVFVGRSGTALVESPYAEIAWFCRPAEKQPVAGTTLYDLHRRQLLVINYLGRADLATNALPLSTDRTSCDISLRRGTITTTTTNSVTGTVTLTTGTHLLPNALGDLTKREHRFMREGLAFPFAFPVVSGAVQTGAGSLTIALAPPQAGFAGTTRASEDVILTNVIAFDVRVFDPRAAVPAVGGATARLPGDPGYTGTDIPPAAAGSGAYVDLGWGGGTPQAPTATFPPAGKTAFQSAGVLVSGTQALPGTYDTWSRHYEFNGVDDDRDGVVDEGLHGVDTNNDGWPELTGDTETSPPYPVPLRGLEVRIRCYEPSSRQVRQVTIRHSFTK